MNVLNREPERDAEASIDDVAESFDLLGDWEQRYQYLIELGEELPPMPEVLKTEENWVKPCMSTVHVHAEPVPGDPERIRFLGDCDTPIIKGVLALLIDLFSNRTLDEIERMDVDRLFKRLNLEEHLSPSRHVGIYAIVDKMRERAAAAAAAIKGKPKDSEDLAR
ncbi:MAG TPA: SufE family protein [Chromatiales bacterium]|nr:SufE family protein [Chromatiales bacterium]